MKYIFDGKEYIKNGHNNNGLGQLIFSIFKYYLKENPNKTYNELKEVFNNTHSWGNRVVFNEEDYNNWLETNTSTRSQQRYFPPINYNNMKLYFTTQWGDNGGHRNNITNFINFAKNDLHYNIDIINTDSADINMDKEEFKNAYYTFTRKLPLKGDSKYLKLYTKAQNKPFRVYRNSQDSIVVHAFEEYSTSMVITLNQLSKVIFDNKEYLYSSYEPVLINKIINNPYISQEDIFEDEIEKLPLNKIKNIILYGVPGVGKTFSHKKIIDLIESREYSDNEIFEKIETHNNLNSYEKVKQDERVKFITFHQSFGYEDFIEGFRPNENGKIILQNGVFKELCEKAEEDKEKKYYLIIDEINRGNISKIFGELITLIEEDKRDSLHVILPYSKKEFSIPSNLYIIGTMNSTDKSIALIDIALRRRFTFIHMQPNPELVKYQRARVIMKLLNRKIKNTIGKEYYLGHSYFMKIKNEEELAFTCKYKIKPLLEEYFYGDEKGLAKILEILDNNV